MIKVERTYKAESIFNKGQEATWDKQKEKSFRISIFGLTLYQTKETLAIEYESLDGKKIGYKKND